MVQLAVDVKDESWRERANCRRETPADTYRTGLFFREFADDDELIVTRQTPKQYRSAKKRCDECPVAEQCLAFALAHRECCGMWGGLTPSDRRRILCNKTRVEFVEVNPGVFEFRDRNRVRDPQPGRVSVDAARGRGRPDRTAARENHVPTPTG